MTTPQRLIEIFKALEHNESSEVEYAALVEVNPAIARQQAEKYNLDSSLIFPSLPEALAAVSAEGVIDVTPPAFHREISTIEFANGVVAAYNDSWCSTGKETPWNGHWRFECERGVIWLHEQWRNYR